MTSPAIVGSAWVVIRATSDKAKADIKKAVQDGWKDNEKQALASGRETGRRWGRGFKAGFDSVKVDQYITGILTDIDRRAGLSGTSAGRNFATNYQRELNRINFPGAGNNPSTSRNGSPGGGSGGSASSATPFDASSIDRANSARDAAALRALQQQQSVLDAIGRANQQRDADRLRALQAQQRLLEQINRANALRDRDAERREQDSIRNLLRQQAIVESIGRANAQRDALINRRNADEGWLMEGIRNANRQRDEAANRTDANQGRIMSGIDAANRNRDAVNNRTEEERVVQIRTTLNDNATRILRVALTSIAALLKSIALLSAAAMAALAGQAAIGGLVAILSTLTQISGLLLTLPALAVAFAVPIATAVIGANGLSDAFKAMKQESAGAADTAKAVASAQKQVVAAQERLESAYEGVEAAEKAATRAARDHERARENVALAIEQVTERMQDLNLELRGTALDEEDALIGVERAAERLRNMPADSSALDRREALNDYRKAQHQLDKVRESNEDVRTEAAKAAEEGVEGSREVIDARQAEQDAADAVVEANKAVVEANQEVVKAQKAVAEAIEGVNEAMRGTNADKFAEAMAKLAPSAQAFVYAMKALGPAWSEFRKSVQENLFAGLGESVTTLANAQLPVLTRQFGQTATILNGIIKDIIGAFSSPGDMAVWETILERVNAALTIARPGILALVGAFKNLVTVGSEFLGRFATGFTENAQQFERWTSNFDHMRNLINNGITAAKLFWDILSGVGGSIKAIFDASNTSGFTEGIAKASLDMETFFKSTEGQNSLSEFFTNARIAMDAVGPVIREILLTVMDLGTFLTGLGAQIAPGVADFFRGLQEVFARLQPTVEIVGPKISNLFTQLGQLGPQLGDTIAALITHFSPWIDILSILSETLLPAFLWILEKMAPVLMFLSPSIVAGAIALKGYAIAIKVVEVATKLWAAAQWIFNAAMAANPITLVVVAIVALVAAFVLAYKNSETFRAIVDKVWAAIKTGALFVWENVLKPFFGWMVDQFKNVGQIFMWVWENLIKPAWDAISTAATWLWENVLSPIFNWIAGNYKDMATVFMYAWENLIKPAWDLFTQAVSWYWDNILSPIFQWIGDRWSDVADGFKWAYENLLKPALDGLGTSLKWVWDNIIEPVFGWLKQRWDETALAFKIAWEEIIKPAWDALSEGMKWAWENVIQPAWKGMEDGLDHLKGFFGEVVDGIEIVWNKLIDIVKHPVRFFVDTVFNNGIRTAWNAVAGLIGADPLPEIKWEEKAKGGIATGTPFPYPFHPQTYGIQSGYSPGRDDRMIAVGGGEPVLRPEAGRVLGSPWVNGINAAARNGGVGGVRRWMREAYANGGIAGYADGGIVESMRRFVATNSPGMSLTSGLRFTDNGYHSKGMAADFSDTSANQSTPGMQRLANIIANTFGPPKTLQLIHHPFNRNIGQGVGWVGDGMGFYGSGTMLEHMNHVHWASDGPVDNLQGDDASVFGTIMSGLAGLAGRGAAAAFDAALTPAELAIKGIASLFNGNNSPFAQFPAGMFTAMKTKLREYIVGKDGETRALLGGGGAMPLPGSGPVMDQVKEAMMPYGWHEGPEWDALVRLVQGESSWNPTARNPSSGAYGLFQFLGSTKDAYLPDENPNPRIQGAAGARYIKDRYGSPSKAYQFWMSQSPHWYDNGGWLKKGLTLVNNETNGPEAVLTGQQWDWVKQGLNFDGANKWLTDQDYGSQFQKIGIDAVKETLGGFTDLVGLTSPMEQLIDLAVERATKKANENMVPGDDNKLADTMIFNGMDPNKVQEELRRTQQQQMTPSSGRYRGGN